MLVCYINQIYFGALPQTSRALRYSGVVELIARPANLLAQDVRVPITTQCSGSVSFRDLILVALHDQMCLSR
jgi:hypothetical protein